MKVNIKSGIAGTYQYYRLTFSNENKGKEIVLLKLNNRLLKTIYSDNELVDLANTRLRIKTIKGGLKVNRILIKNK